MQRGASLEVNNDRTYVQQDHNSEDIQASCVAVSHNVPLSQESNTELIINANVIENINEHKTRGRKRKLMVTSPGKTSRNVSPPWKKVAVEGPTSFVEDGRRKSSRTNVIPLELQPSIGARQTRAGRSRKTETNNVPTFQSVNKTIDHRGTIGKRESLISSARNSQFAKGDNSPNSQISRQQVKRKATVLPASPSQILHSNTPDSASQIVPEQFPEQSHSRRKRRHSSGNRMIVARSNELPTEVTPPFSYVYKPIKSLRLNFRPPPLPILNPGNIVSARQHTSLKSLLIEDDPLEGEDERRLNDHEAKIEASIILRLEEAAQPGGLLSVERWTGDVTTIQGELPLPYTHPDYLLKHIVDFQPRLERERAQHITLAKRLAYLALAEWRRRQPQTVEELLAQKRAEQESIRKKVLKELDQLWAIARSEVKRKKLVQYMEEQEVHTKNQLKKMLDQSTQLVMERRRKQAGIDDEEDSSGSGQDDISMTKLSAGSHDSGNIDDDDDDDDDNDEGSLSDTKSDTSNSSRSKTEFGDNILSREELLQKYSNLPDFNHSLHSKFGHSPMNVSTVSKGKAAVLDEVDVEIEDSVIEISEGHNTSTHRGGSKRLDSPSKVEVNGFGSTEYQAQDGAEELFEEPDEDDEDDEYSNEADSDEDDEDDDDDDDDDDNSAVVEGDASDQELVKKKDDAEDAEDIESEKEFYGNLLGFYDTSQQRAWQHDSSKDDVENDSVKVRTETTEVMRTVEDSKPVAFENADRAHSATQHQLANNMTLVSAFSQVDHSTPSFNSTSEDVSRQLSPSTTHTGKPSEVDSMTSPEPCEDLEARPSKTKLNSETTQTAVSPLLRGDLRTYQHAGVDWLAGMYANRTNGILADEMGLGKTIQTIALLAHLATAHHVWGPHLVVVPTSVMLNWEMEFKKWCPGFKIMTYYGTPEERKLKRQGWRDNDRWHVCITSYQLALQDAKSLKLRDWHYMVLDEAHNIKNFRSLRWQTLLNFKTEARLLLTGTPLQNNLTELWSLLFFLEPARKEHGGFTFTDLGTFSRTFHRPVDQILEHGREEMDDEARELISKLHKVLRPHLLRRLKADVEKQMPKKYEHIVKCRLSKRQRQLYDGYMGLADTRESFQSGNYLSIINCLMQLRKVCNHPDLFETRQIVTSYAMPKSAVAQYEIQELLVRKRLIDGGRIENLTTSSLNLWYNNTSVAGTTRSKALAALEHLSEAARRQEHLIKRSSTTFDLHTVTKALLHVSDQSRRARLSQICDHHRLTAVRSERQPLYSEDLLRRLKFTNSLRPEYLRMDQGTSSTLNDMVLSVEQRSKRLDVVVQKFACITPAVVAPGLSRLALTDYGMEIIARGHDGLVNDPFHEARTRLAIAFPDKGLIQYDCGKLQALDRLLRKLQAGGHRALIFTQMTKVLDILERFLNLHGHLYLRLDGSTKIEQRQILTDRFNNDTRILTFILSTRSGGLGINLTGADTVIFYDLDWNPAMDKQCQDRCHRIGQTRDVHIYRFVSEGTIEANILRKSNQKRMLDDVVIQEGDFTTDYFNKINPLEFLDDNEEADAALDKVLGSSDTRTGRVFEQAEDREDIEAAHEAQKEYVPTDDADFEEKLGYDESGTPKTDVPLTSLPRESAPLTGSVNSPAASAPGRSQDIGTMKESEVCEPTVEQVLEEEQHHEQEEQEPGSHEEFMLRYVTWELQDVIIRPSSDRARKKAKKGKDHTSIRIRR